MTKNTVIIDLGGGWFRVVVTRIGNDGSTGNAVQGSHTDVLAERITFDLIAETLCENDAGSMEQAIWRTR